MFHRRAILAAAILSGLTVAVQAQINAYAEVTALAGTTLTLGLVNETFGSFEDGDQAILMQMQDDVIGGNLVNNAAFGNLSSINSAGRWEVVTISTHAENTGVPVSITTQAPPTYVYHFGPKCSVQLISFMDRGSPDWTTSAPINAMPWDGTLGGVVALRVSGTLTLAYDIRADGAGFRRGGPSTDYAGACANTTYTATITNYGEKGEGLQRRDPAADRYARGKFATGGGGGNPNNAGGGGGGNVTAGGVGGGGYSCAAGGIPGIPVNVYLQPSRFFMGGGGGGGQQNNGVGGAGGAGGGIAIVSMNILRTVGPCGGLFISANGANGQSSVGAPPDGAGGGGAGGSVYLIVNGFQIDPTCTVMCQANGGNGGGVTNTTPSPGNWVDCGGGGAGGGQGLCLCGGGAAGTGGNGGSGWAGMGAGTSAGQGGTHNPSGGHAANGAGVPGLGVAGFPGGSGLPVELLSFDGLATSEGVRLDWSTATEHNSASFDVQRSKDGTTWGTIASVPASGESVSTKWYSALDREPLSAVNYYRLHQIDLDGHGTFYPAVAVEWNTSGPILFYPNPADDQLVVSRSDEAVLLVTLFDATGREVLRKTLGTGERTLQLSDVTSGTYQLIIQDPLGDPLRLPVIIQH